MKYVLSVLLCIGFNALVYSQQRTLRVSFENVKYDSLQCVCAMEGFKQFPTAQGVYDDKRECWFFHFPDTVFDRYVQINFRGKRNDAPQITYIHPSFRVNSDSIKTYFHNGILFWELADTVCLNARLVEQDTIRNSRFYGVDNVILRQNFDLINPSPDLRRSLINENLLLNTPKEKRYEVLKKIFMEAPEAPFANIHTLYNNKAALTYEQLKTLVGLFDGSVEQCYYYREVKKYLDFLSNRFEDTLLTNCLTKEKEFIISDKDKYTLLVFSASWCAPCHALIPILKELYEMKKDVLDIVYFTVDEPKQLDNWNKLMEKEQIPWRSLTPLDSVRTVQKKYDVQAIPDAYLIYPKGVKFERINVRKKEAREKVEGLKL